jgi:hypothetical protein
VGGGMVKVIEWLFSKGEALNLNPIYPPFPSENKKEKLLEGCFSKENPLIKKI